MLDIRYDITFRYMIEFGKNKSQAMIINGNRSKDNEDLKFYLWEMEIDIHKMISTKFVVKSWIETVMWVIKLTT